MVAALSVAASGAQPPERRTPMPQRAIAAPNPDFCKTMVRLLRRSSHISNLFLGPYAWCRTPPFSCLDFDRMRTGRHGRVWKLLGQLSLQLVQDLRIQRVLDLVRTAVDDCRRHVGVL